ncbi:uncharacterized protein SETTUDRAFT_168914 [Exserohilum turcica Et28A]|uniref:Uncharacterized protein n=1 Tax=Exserohilum turcicum (strain 28A) TaxID=671987 RepID=R0ISH6_EXST2|nr:uncharacterized protein SETTUDRAFT_168914 [Exserohilum turcica Et28A]EOA87795.1 hypothetical protein SETTUDRAFT_168914 [Exserohilum turcica Et28A]
MLLLGSNVVMPSRDDRGPIVPYPPRRITSASIAADIIARVTREVGDALQLRSIIAAAST